jgi:CheY-like chemotaxis protein
MNAFFETIELMARPLVVSFPKKRILFASDNLPLRELLSSLLEEEGYLTETAPCELAKIEKKDAAIDLILLDMKMPLEDEWETFEQLSGKYPWLPIILITDRPNQFFPVLAAGVDALLEKPLDLIKLFDTIQNLLEETADGRLSRTISRPSVFRYFPASYEPTRQPDPPSQALEYDFSRSGRTINECAPGAGEP